MKNELELRISVTITFNQCNTKSGGRQQKSFWAHFFGPTFLGLFRPFFGGWGGGGGIDAWKPENSGLLKL